MHQGVKHQTKNMSTYTKNIGHYLILGNFKQKQQITYIMISNTMICRIMLPNTMVKKTKLSNLNTKRKHGKPLAVWPVASTKNHGSLPRLILNIP